MNIQYIKLRNGEDLVATVLSSDDQSITIKRPVCIMVENYLDEGRQYINVREWLPPMIAESDTITLDKKEVIAQMNTAADFVDQYEDICEMFFESKPVLRKESTKKTKQSVENVVSIIEALAEKKDKPTH